MNTNIGGETKMNYDQIPSVVKIPLNEKVYRVLVKAIVDGSLLPGTELKEQHIARQMDVSATPVREALKRLVSDGLVEIIPYHGAIVKKMDRQEIREAYACRETLEHLAIKEAIEHASEEDIRQLYELIDSFRNATDVEKISAFSQKFDEYIYTLARNNTLYNLLCMLKGIISRDRMYSSANPDRQKEIYKEHLDIVRAMEGKNISSAQEAISRHIRNGQRYIEKKYEKAGRKEITE